MHRRQIGQLIKDWTCTGGESHESTQAEILVTSQTLVTVQTTVFVFSKYHVIWSFLNVFNAYASPLGKKNSSLSFEKL